MQSTFQLRGIILSVLVFQLIYEQFVFNNFKWIFIMD